jgi:hypothetical protein
LKIKNSYDDDSWSGATDGTKCATPGTAAHRSVHAQVIAAGGTAYLIPTSSNYSIRMEARKTLARD